MTNHPHELIETQSGQLFKKPAALLADERVEIRITNHADPSISELININKLVTKHKRNWNEHF